MSRCRAHILRNNSLLPAFQPRGTSAPATPFHVPSAFDGSGLKALENAGLRALENAGLRALENAGLRALENAGLRALENAGLRAADGGAVWPEKDLVDNSLLLRDPSSEDPLLTSNALAHR